MLAVLLFGPPGAGKGTQAAAVAAASGVPHIATGDMFREHLRSNSELGKLARSYMERGDLVPDDVTIGMLAERIEQSDALGGFVLDGFPRTADQAVALDKEFRPVMRGGSPVITGVGSSAVRQALSRFQPMLSLHGHIHESRGEARIGKTLALNPGSEYSEGVLRGVETGWFTQRIAEAAYEEQRRTEAGHLVQVGVNAFQESDEPPLEILEITTF